MDDPKRSDRMIEILINLALRTAVSKSSSEWDMADLKYATGWTEDIINEVMYDLERRSIVRKFTDYSSVINLDIITPETIKEKATVKWYIPIRTYRDYREMKKQAGVTCRFGRFLDFHVKKISEWKKGSKLFDTSLYTLFFGFLLNYTAHIFLNTRLEWYTFPAYGLLLYFITIEFPDFIKLLKNINKKTSTKEEVEY